MFECASDIITSLSWGDGAYIIINNENESGSTVHFMEEGIDTGAIILQRKVPLTRFDTVRSMQRKVYSIEPDLIAEALELLKNREFKPQVQDETQATIYPKWRKTADSEIDPNKSLLELFDFIRACDPDEYPAFFFVEGQKICLRMWRPERPPSEDNDML